MKATVQRWIWGLTSLVAVLGCGDPLLERQSITRLRVLGARYEPQDDPQRASPLPRELGRVHWLVVGPDGPLEVTYALLACAARERVRGLPACAAPPVAQSDGQGAEPTIELEVPAATRLLVAGVFCGAGQAHLTADLMGSGCSNPGVEQELASYELEVVDEGAPVNRHPDLTDAVLRWNEVVWDSEESCVAAGRDHLVGLSLPAGARELLATGESTSGWETLQVSYLSTEGRFERPFMVFGSEATELDDVVVWQAPESPGIAHLYFVVRDLRGGVSWFSRRVCVE